MPADRYHHGDLRRAVLDAALEVIAESGPAGVSLRGLARRVGVSHAGPAHHFGSKKGVFTALAAEGFTMFADALEQSAPSGSMADLGVVYVRFALAHRAHFEVMFRPELYDVDDPAVVESGDRARSILRRTARAAATQTESPSPLAVEVGAWALVHGLATLVAAGAVDLESEDDVEPLVRQAAGLLFRPPAP